MCGTVVLVHVHAVLLKVNLGVEASITNQVDDPPLAVVRRQTKPFGQVALKK
jgi:hypothetical protein